MHFKQFLSTLKIKEQEKQNASLVEEVTKEIYEEIPNAKVAEIIKEYHEVKVTDTLIESYLELASSKDRKSTR